MHLKIDFNQTIKPQLICLCWFLYILSVHSTDAANSTLSRHVQVLFPLYEDQIPITSWNRIIIAVRGMERKQQFAALFRIDVADEEDRDRVVWDREFLWAWTNRLATWRDKEEWSRYSICLLRNSCEPAFLKLINSKQIQMSIRVEILDEQTNVVQSADQIFFIRGNNLQATHKNLQGSRSIKDSLLLSFAQNSAWMNDFSSKVHTAVNLDKGIDNCSPDFKQPSSDTEHWTQNLTLADELRKGSLSAAWYVFESTNEDLAWSLCSPDTSTEAFMFPVFVMNLANRLDRKHHIGKMMKSLGFLNVTYPRSTHGDELDLAGLILDSKVWNEDIEKLVKQHGMAAVRPHLAHAADFLEVIRQASSQNYSLFAIFEDDLIAGACPDVINRKIAAAINELPADADLLYLEACFENCDQLLYSRRRPNLARAVNPFCTGAILFTAAGARKVLALCTRIFATIDDMFASLISKHFIKAFLALPGLLYQDGFWGSDAHRKKNLPFQVGRSTKQQHVIFAPLCVNGVVPRFSGIVTALPPPQTLAIAWGHPQLRTALSHWIHNDDTFCNESPDACRYAILWDPSMLCPPGACHGRPGGRIVVVTAANEMDYWYLDEIEIGSCDPSAANLNELGAARPTRSSVPSQASANAPQSPNPIGTEKAAVSRADKVGHSNLQDRQNPISAEASYAQKIGLQDTTDESTMSAAPMQGESRGREASAGESAVAGSEGRRGKCSGPLLLRLSPACECFRNNVCAIAVVRRDAHGVEVERHSSFLMVTYAH